MKAAIEMSVIRFRINSSWLGFVPRKSRRRASDVSELSAVVTIGCGSARGRWCPGGHAINPRDVVAWTRR